MDEAIKTILVDIAMPHQLKKTAGPPAESLSATQAKVLLAITKKPDLTHVEAPKAGLTDAEKQAYLEEKKSGPLLGAEAPGQAVPVVETQSAQDQQLYQCFLDNVTTHTVRITEASDKYNDITAKYLTNDSSEIHWDTNKVIATMAQLIKVINFEMQISVNNYQACLASINSEVIGGVPSENIV